MAKIKITTDSWDYMGLPMGHMCNANVQEREARFVHNGKEWRLSSKDYQVLSEEYYFAEPNCQVPIEPIPNTLRIGDDLVNTSPKKATEFLSKALSLLEERGKDYDQPEGERSMGRTVTAFNAITGHSLKESDGWLLLQLLKDVRQNQNRDSYHADSAEDCISYAALKAEALAENK